jgi:hypothetical protein
MDEEFDWTPIEFKDLHPGMHISFDYTYSNLIYKVIGPALRIHYCDKNPTGQTMNSWLTLNNPEYGVFDMDCISNLKCRQVVDYDLGI